MRDIVMVAHNLRSCHNVGSLLRTADGLGVSGVILSGYTPYPREDHDRRLPHEVQKIQHQIHKTALGAETTVHWDHVDNVAVSIRQLQQDGYRVLALEQTPSAQPLPTLQPPGKLALVVGREVEGLEPDVLALCGDGAVEIPMSGQKESFNVTVAAAMALYHATFCYT